MRKNRSEECSLSKCYRLMENLPPKSKLYHDKLNGVMQAPVDFALSLFMFHERKMDALAFVHSLMLNLCGVDNQHYF